MTQSQLLKKTEKQFRRLLPSLTHLTLTNDTSQRLLDWARIFTKVLIRDIEGKTFTQSKVFHRAPIYPDRSNSNEVRESDIVLLNI